MVDRRNYKTQNSNYEENAIKFYFTIIALFVSVILFLFRGTNLNSEVQKLA